MSLISTTPIYKGRVIELNLERVELPNGHCADLEIIHHPGGAAIVAIDTQQRVCLVRQFRHAANGWIWELPAGKIDNREPPLTTAQRELEEEAGMRAQRWESLGDYVSSPGVFTEVVHLFMATGLEAVPTRHEDHEVLEIHWLPLDRAVSMAHSGELRDGKSVVGVFRAAARL
jgi:8-oxo-dGTP pyrophosphatase MutT (NUDIX family)